GLSSGGTLLLGGTSRDDSVSLSIRSSDQKLLATIGKVAKAFKNSLLRRIVVNSYGGNDSITVGAGVRGIYADGGSSNDTLRGGDGNDTLYGNSGRDSIDGGAGNDSLLGGGSSDVLIGGTGSDRLDGGA